MQETPLNDSINELKQFQEAVKKAAEQSPDVKDGKVTAEEELQEPGYMLYNQIAESSIKILELPEVVKAFAKLTETFGEETSKSLVELFALTMTQSSYQAVLFYDSLLKEELGKQLDNIGVHLNGAKADIEGIKPALTVFKKQIGEIQKKLEIDKFVKDNNITPKE